LSQYGGTVAAGFELAMNSPSGGTIWYTTNGEDPRLLGGGINMAAASAYTDPVAIEQSLTIKARTLVGDVWSPLSETTLFASSSFQGIVISEINYHPHDPTTTEAAAVPGVVKDDFEFIEILNTHPTQAISLMGMSLANGLTHSFGNTLLAPG